MECLFKLTGLSSSLKRARASGIQPERAPQLLANGHGAERRTAFPSHETQGLGAERRTPFSSHELVDVPAASWRCRDQGVDSPAGTPPQRATLPKTGGRLTQAPAGTNPTTGQAVVIFKNLEFDGHVLVVSSTSRTTVSRRSVPRVAFRLVGDCGTGDVITVRFPLVCCPQYGVLWYLFSLCV